MSAQPPRERTYRVRLWNKVSSVLATLIILGILAFCIHDALVSGYELNKLELLFLMAVAFGGVFYTAQMFLSYLTFTQDQIEMSDALKIRAVPLASISGRRERIRYRPKSRVLCSVLVSSDGRYPDLEFSKNLFDFDDAYWEWYQGLTDLDAEEERLWREKKAGVAKVSR
ncbi:MAG TPA: hypothetical protein VGJ21_03695 [Terracidiphilus sp.]|jgi:hypothetical protein